MVFSFFQLLSVTVAVVAQATPTDDMIGLLREWELDHVFETAFRVKGYTANMLIGGSKEDFDEVFTDFDALHRRSLFNHIQDLGKINRRLASVKKDPLAGYTGLRIKKDKSYILLGEKSDVQLYRAANGNLKIVAPSVDFSTGSVLVNGKILAGKGKGKDKSLTERVTALEKAFENGGGNNGGGNNGGPKPTPKPTPNPSKPHPNLKKPVCDPSFGIDSVRAWNTKVKHHDVDLTRSFQQFDLDGSILRDVKQNTGFQIDANIFWYIGVKTSTPCPAASFYFTLGGNLHHLRTAYSNDGKKWTCASNYIDYQGNNRKFTGCKGGHAPNYHGKTGVIRFDNSAKYYAFGFRDAGLVSELDMKCGSKIVLKAVHKYRGNDGKCKDCPTGYGCDGRTGCPKTKMSVNGYCQNCPTGYTCDGVGKFKCLPQVGIQSVMAWNTGQKNHDVDLTKAWVQFKTDGKSLRDDNPATGFTIVSNIFWYIAVKINKPCPNAVFNFALTGNLHHLRTAISDDGFSWDCTSDYTDYQNKDRKFTGCKGGSAPSFHGKTQSIRFTKSAKYYAFGFRDAGLVSQIEMKCEGRDIGEPSPSHVEGNKCLACPDGFTCDNKKKTKCTGAKYVTGNVCKPCPKQGYTCKDGVKTLCQRSFGIQTAMAWNTRQKNHDVDLTKRFSEFDTPAEWLVDNDAKTGVVIDANIFWYIGIELSGFCRNAIFQFTLTGNLHHLRTAYSLDGNAWTCASDYKDYQNNNRKFTGCKGGSAPNYHGRSGDIRFSKLARYYAFGFRDAGKVSSLTMTCDGQSVPYKTTGKYVQNNVCKDCPPAYSCSGSKKTPVKIDKCMAWNTGQKNHDVGLTRSFAQFTTNGAVFIDNNGGTGTNIGSNIFWYIGVKLTAQCYKATFTFQLTGNLHHLRTAYSQDGNSWTCASDYTDYQNNARAFSGCKGGYAPNYHGKTGAIRFNRPAKYYAFGFRDAGKVSGITVTCDGSTLSKK